MKTNFSLPAVSVVIPSFQGQTLLAKNLPAVFACLRDGDEVIVVDDASGKDDPTLAYFAQQFQLHKQAFDRFPAEYYRGDYREKKKHIRVSLLINMRNMRFAVTANRGVSIAQHPIVFLLNTDVIPQANVLDTALPHFAKPTVFAVACLENEIRLHKKGGKNKLFFHRGLFVHSRANDLTAGPTAWATGGSSFFRKAMWDELKGFDQRYYPAYWEDIDLSFQAHKRGWQVLFEPQAVVVHDHETTNSSVFGQKKIADMSWKNGLTFTKKNANWLQRIAFYVWQPYWWLQRARQ